MGGGVSRPPGARQMVLYSLSRKTHFEKGELSKLHVKFRELAAKEGNPYTITLADFQEALTFVGIDESDGTLLAAVFKQMDLTDSGVETGQVNFSQFCAVCSSMLSGPMEEKLDFSFALYDTNGTGLVEKTGMVEILTAINSAASFFGDPTLSPEECTELVDTIFKEHDTDGTGSLSYKQYMSAIVANPRSRRCRTTFFAICDALTEPKPVFASGSDGDAPSSHFLRIKSSRRPSGRLPSASGLSTSWNANCFFLLTSEPQRTRFWARLCTSRACARAFCTVKVCAFQCPPQSTCCKISFIFAV